jgi:hypothetical protein
MPKMKRKRIVIRKGDDLYFDAKEIEAWARAPIKMDDPITIDASIIKRLGQLTDRLDKLATTEPLKKLLSEFDKVSVYLTRAQFQQKNMRKQ